MANWLYYSGIYNKSGGAVMWPQGAGSINVVGLYDVVHEDRLAVGAAAAAAPDHT